MVTARETTAAVGVPPGLILTPVTFDLSNNPVKSGDQSPFSEAGLSREEKLHLAIGEGQLDAVEKALKPTLLTFRKVDQAGDLKNLPGHQDRIAESARALFQQAR